MNLGRIIRKIKEELKEEEFVVCLKLVGSYADFRVLNKITDLDFLIIVNKLDCKKYEMIKRKLQKIVRNSNYNFWIENRVAPIKKHFKKPTIIIHQILFDKESYRKYCKKSPLACFDWQRYKPLFGKLPYRVNGISYSDLVNARLGINFYLNSIRKKKIKYLYYVNKNGKCLIKVKEIKLTNRDIYSLIFKGVYNTIVNLLKIKLNSNKRYNPEKTLNLFLKEFPIFLKYKEFLITVFRRKVENKKDFEINFYEFFRELKSYIKKQG